MEIQAGELRRAVQLLQKVAPRKSALPIRVGILFGHKEARAGNGLVDLAVALPEATGEPFVTPARGLADALAALADREPVDVRPSPRGGLLLKAHATERELAAMPAKDYPSFPAVDGLAPASGSIDGQRLVAVLERLYPYTASDKGRAQLMGVCIDWSAEPTQAAASDGYRLAWEALPDFPLREGAREALVPREAVPALSAAFAAHGAVEPHRGPISVAALAAARKPIAVRFDHSVLSLAMGRATLACQLIQSPFPSWRQVIPGGPPLRTVAVDSADLTAALQRLPAGSFARLEWDQGELRVTAYAGGYRTAVAIEAETAAYPEAATQTAPIGLPRAAFKREYLLAYAARARGQVHLSLGGGPTPAVGFSNGGGFRLAMAQALISWGDAGEGATANHAQGEGQEEGEAEGAEDEEEVPEED